MPLLNVRFWRKAKSFMDKAKIELVKNWLSKGKHDLDTAKILSESESSLLDTAIYHCQQAAEKAIKGFLTFHDIRFEKTHDILSLLTLALPKSETLSAYLDIGNELTPYASEFRYPGDEATPGKDEFQTALDSANKIYQGILSLLPSETHPRKRNKSPKAEGA